MRQHPDETGKRETELEKNNADFTWDSCLVSNGSSYWSATSFYRPSRRFRCPDQQRYRNRRLPL